MQPHFNVEITLINISRLNFHFQSNINVEATLMTVDSTLMCLLAS